LEVAETNKTIEGLKMQTLAKIPDMINSPATQLPEIRSLYEVMRADMTKLRNVMVCMAQVSFDVATQSRLQSAYGLVMAMALLLNTLLRSFKLDNGAMPEDSVAMVDEMIVLAQESAQFKPFGCMAMPIFLVIAWASTRKVSKKHLIESLLAEYKSSYYEDKWMTLAIWLDANLNQDRFGLAIDLPPLYASCSQGQTVSS
jgi:hypothetical protein